MEKPFISVIVTAYNRKQFLLEALKSVVNQTLSRDKYEVIVTKNFRDEEINKFISDNKMKSILFTDMNIGQMISDAIKLCEGEVITFLNDDDSWSKDRLERVYNVFKNYNVGFYHNSGIHNKLDEDYSGILKQLGVTDKNKYKIIDYPYKSRMYIKNWGNSSSLALTKSVTIRHLDEISMCYAGDDLLLFLITLFEKLKLFIDLNKLTFIRVHKRGKILEEEIKSEEVEIKTLFNALNLARRYDSPAGVSLTKLQIFYPIIQTEMLRKTSRRKLIKDALKFFPGLKFITKRFIKRSARLLVYIISPGYADRLIIKELKEGGKIN
jgi:glycosyltransferase involved in cell wall biosynthesis